MIVPVHLLLLPAQLAGPLCYGSGLLFGDWLLVGILYCPHSALLWACLRGLASAGCMTRLVAPLVQTVSVGGSLAVFFLWPSYKLVGKLTERRLLFKAVLREEVSYYIRPKISEGPVTSVLLPCSGSYFLCDWFS
jgi:hypothetical protein